MTTDQRLEALEKQNKKILGNQAYLESLLFAVCNKAVDPKNFPIICKMAEESRQKASQ